jgi:hypothetical protein
MPLNKLADWGKVPVPRRPLGLTAIMRTRLDALNAVIEAALPEPPTVVAVPSVTALRVVWSLNAVRDALSDQGDPNVSDTNDQIAQRMHSDAVREIAEHLKQHHAELLLDYETQFLPLEADPDDLPGFDLERRERLAELAAFELRVMAEVDDPPPQPPGPNTAVSAARRGGKRR